MANLISLRLPDKILDPLDKLSELLERPRTYLIKKALEKYLSEYADYQIAMDRLHDKDDEILTSEEMRKNLGL